jgi:hypothetical protein
LYGEEINKFTNSLSLFQPLLLCVEGGKNGQMSILSLPTQKYRGRLMEENDLYCFIFVCQTKFLDFNPNRYLALRTYMD